MEFLDESCYYTDFFIHAENRRYTLKNVYCHQPIFFSLILLNDYLSLLMSVLRKGDIG